MQSTSHHMMWLVMGESLIRMQDCEVLSDVKIDDFEFKVCWSPKDLNFCILWFRDARVDREFRALGKFSQFDKREVLLFITRYCTNEELREEIEQRKLEYRLACLPPEFFERLLDASDTEKACAYRYLFALDNMAPHDDLAKKRRIMARKLHPDCGGNAEAMSVINQAYEYLVKSSSSR